MKYKELKTLSATEREKRLQDAKIELLKLNAQVATGTTPKSPGKISQLKRTIARLKMFEAQNQDTQVTTKKTEEIIPKNG